LNIGRTGAAVGTGAALGTGLLNYYFIYIKIM
jgi:hypothetical protein